MYWVLPLVLTLVWGVSIYVLELSLWSHTLLVAAVVVLVFNLVRRADRSAPQPVPDPVPVRDH